MEIVSFAGTAFTGIGYVGYDANTAGQPTGPTNEWVVNNSVKPLLDGSNYGAASTNFGTGTQYLMNILHRTTGCFYMMKGGIYTNWTLVDHRQTGTTSTLYPVISETNGNYTADFIRIPITRYLPVPLASDGFATAFGTTDGKGTLEGVNDSTGKGGNGVAWTARMGSDTVVSAVALAKSLTSGISIATVPCATQDVMVQAGFTRGTGTGPTGIVYRYADTSNFAVSYLDSTSGACKTYKRVLGVYTLVDSTSVTYSAGAGLRVVCNGTSFAISYNYAAVKTVTMSEAILGSAVGLYFSNLVDKLDNFSVFARGNGNEYSYLDRFATLTVSGPDTSKTQIAGLGHSMIYQGQILTTLTDSLGASYATLNKGANGNTVAQMSARLNDDVIVPLSTNTHQKYLVVLGGIVEITWDTSAATVQTNLQAIYTAAHNAGFKVIAVTNPPFKNYSAWSAGRQTVLDAVNAWIMNTATNVDYRVDAYTVLEDGGNPDTFNATYDSGDHLHPNVAGYRLIGATIYHAVTW
jgi:lysophospholipase L1-like esterase